MSKRILVVEDQPDGRQIIRDMLAGTGYEITEAQNGEEALTAIAKQRPDRRATNRRRKSLGIFVSLSLLRIILNTGRRGDD